MLKRYNATGVRPGLSRLRWFRSSRAYRCWRNGLVLEALGLGTPHPCLFLEQRGNHWWHRRAYLLCDKVAGVTLEQLINREQPTAAVPPAREDGSVVAEQLINRGQPTAAAANLTANQPLAPVLTRVETMLNILGCYHITHGDLHAANILVDTNHQVTLLDLDAMRLHRTTRQFYKHRARGLGPVHQNLNGGPTRHHTNQQADPVNPGPSSSPAPMARLSCIIPTYNYGDRITGAVESLLPVVRAGDQIIVVDDGSTDHTRAVLDGYRNAGAIQYYTQANAGAAAARNRGSQLASGDYVYFLDADDQTIAAGFARLRQTVEHNPHLAAAFGGHLSSRGPRRSMHRVDAIGPDREANFLGFLLHRTIAIANGAVLLRRDIALRYPFAEALKLAEDIPAYAWLLANEDVAAIADPVVDVIKHPNSLRSQTADYAQTMAHLVAVVF